MAVGIVVLLTAIGFSTFSNFQRNSRDVKRQADLKIVQSALEQYHADQNFYPTALNFSTSLTNGTGRTSTPSASPRVYLSQFPKDPMSSTTGYQYSYWATPTNCNNGSSSPTVYCTGYNLCAKLENPPSGNSCPADTTSNLNYQVNAP